MRKPILLTLLTLALAVPSFAEERHQSYLSYDDGGTIVRSGEDQEIEAHRNLPIYPGDEVVTARRGRAEVRLSDGNIIGIDRTTALRFRSILDSYEGDANETVAELQYGKIAIYRTDVGRDHVRLDTNNASYVAEHESIYSVETDANGSDRVTVFEGSIEVRTPARATRLRAGESITIDERGAYDIVSGRNASADDFERWFLQRADRFENYSSKYVDRDLGYWADDLDDNGQWVFVTGIGWSWRPYVAVGWRPYYNGYWHHSRYGTLTWVSYDPWGWGPYHYGRWAYDPGFGWIWVPGHGYSPAWVYWMYGSGYVGWAPAGWWDCYRPYYNWAYQPYRDYGVGSHSFGFYGRVRVSELDLRPWTFVDSGTFVSRRVDRAALTIDAVKERLGRNRDAMATMAGGPSRFTREEFRDPAEAIRRRALDGRLSGRESAGPPTDLTPFARRESDVSGTIRDRVARDRGGNVGTVAGGGAVATPPRPLGGGIAPRGGSVAPIGRGSVAPIVPGSVAPTTGADRGNGNGPAVATPPASGRTRTIGGGDRDRGRTRETIGRDRPDNPDGTRDRSSRNWRGTDRSGSGPRVAPPAPEAPRETPERAPRDNWRARPRTDESPGAGVRDRSGVSDVPRRVIDRIGGARVVPRNDSGDRATTRERSSSSGGRERSVSRDSGSRSSGSSASSGSSSRSSGSSASSGSSSRSGGSSTSSGGSSSGGSRGGGGRIKRD